MLPDMRGLAVSLVKWHGMILAVQLFKFFLQINCFLGSIHRINYSFFGYNLTWYFIFADLLRVVSCFGYSTLA